MSFSLKLQRIFLFLWNLYSSQPYLKALKWHQETRLQLRRNITKVQVHVQEYTKYWPHFLLLLYNAVEFHTQQEARVGFKPLKTHSLSHEFPNKQTNEKRKHYQSIHLHQTINRPKSVVNRVLWGLSCLTLDGNDRAIRMFYTEFTHSSHKHPTK